jgi:hypothetical protein
VDVHEVDVVRDESNPTYLYLVVLLLNVSLAPLRELRVYPVGEHEGLILYQAVSEIPLQDVPEVVARYQIVVTLPEHLLGYLVLLRLLPVVVQVMVRRYLVLEVIDVVYYDRLVLHIVNLPKVLYDYPVLPGRPVKLQDVALVTVRYRGRLSVYENVVIRVLIHDSPYRLLYPVVRRSRRLGYRE